MTAVNKKPANCGQFCCHLFCDGILKLNNHYIILSLTQTIRFTEDSDKLKLFFEGERGKKRVFNGIRLWVV